MGSEFVAGRLDGSHQEFATGAEGKRVQLRHCHMFARRWVGASWLAEEEIDKDDHDHNITIPHLHCMHAHYCTIAVADVRGPFFDRHPACDLLFFQSLSTSTKSMPILRHKADQKIRPCS